MILIKIKSLEGKYTYQISSINHQIQNLDEDEQTPSLKNSIGFDLTEQKEETEEDEEL